MATQGAGFSKDRDHLSMLDVYLLRHPQTMEKVSLRANNLLSDVLLIAVLKLCPQVSGTSNMESL